MDPGSRDEGLFLFMPMRRREGSADLVGPEYTLRAVNYILGTHPVFRIAKPLYDSKPD